MSTEPKKERGRWTSKRKRDAVLRRVVLPADALRRVPDWWPITASRTP